MFRKLAISCAFAVVVAAAPARTRPRYGETLRVEIAGDPWERPHGPARRLVLDGLTEIGPDGNVRAALATSWAAENGFHRWQFKLRSGLRFHDGPLVTSTAIAASLMRACSAQCPWSSVHALGTSLVFTNDEPMRHLPAILAGDEFLISNPQSSSSDGGTGAFQVASFASGVLTLTANESCWQGRPFVDSIEIRVHRAVSDQWLDLSVGRADLVEVPPDQIRQAQQQHLNVAASGPVETVALQVSDVGALANANVRSSIGYAIDRNALSNVIFQKQGIATAALLPQSLSGFAFLFPAERDLNKAHELRGGGTPQAISLEAEGSGSMQLAAQRIVINLREAGFNVQLAAPGVRHADLTLRTLRVESADSAADLEEMARAAGDAIPVAGSDASAVYSAERGYLDRKTLIPLVHLPRAYAVGSRVRDFQLRFDGTPNMGSVSVEAAK